MDVDVLIPAAILEWIQNLQWFFLEVSEERTRLLEVMHRAFKVIWSLAKRRQIDLLPAAYLLVVHWVGKAIRQRGIFP
jgi:glutamate dehydrogenase/leucine dehydrogenase